MIILQNLISIINIDAKKRIKKILFYVTKFRFSSRMYPFKFVNIMYQFSKTKF